jgi:methyltransferase
VRGDTACLAAVGTAVTLLIAEAVLSRRHERALRARGAREPEHDVYRVMQVAYPLCFIAMAAEGWWQGPPVPGIFWSGLALFAIAKGLKYWAVATLGDRWTFRVLIPPDSPRVVSGPYAFLRHPNYIAVAGELIAFAMMMDAPIAGPVATAGFTALMLRRLRVEERALGLNT